MGKRSEFERRPQDRYYTPNAGILPLLPFLEPNAGFAEPCAGNGQLARYMARAGHVCHHMSDIEPDAENIEILDARQYKTDNSSIKFVITNPPWSRNILHELIEYLPTVKPTWLLFDADWMHTRQSAGLIKTCSKIVSVGRLKWIEGSKHTGKDNCCWYLFPGNHEQGPHFYGRT